MGRLTLNNRWSVLGLVLSARMDMAVQFQAVSPLVQPIGTALSLSQSQLGLLIGIILAPGVVLALPGGLLMARFGDRNSLLLGQGLMTAGALMFGLGASYSWAVAGRLVGGFGVVLTSLVSTKIVTDWFAGKEIGTSMGIMLSAWPLGIALALSTLGAVAGWAGWQAAVLLTAALSAFNFTATLLLYRDPPRVTASRKEGAGSSALWHISGPELYLIGTVGCVWMLCNSAFVLLVGFTPGVLVGQGVAVTTAGLTAGLASWPMIVTVPFGGWITDKVGHVNALITVGSLAAASMILLVATGIAVPVWMVLFGLLGGVWGAAIMTLPGQVLSPAARGTGLGVFYGILYGGESVFPYVAGRLQDVTGNPASALWLAAALMALTAAALGGFRVLQRRLSMVGAQAA